MTNELDRLVHKYHSRGVLVTTNLLLLYFVGKYHPDPIARFKRTQSRGFRASDYGLLVAILSNFQRIVTTPNILTEVSNLLGQFTACVEVFAQEITTLDEQVVRSATVAQTEVFRRLGLTDAGILSLAQGEYLVLTEDAALAYSLIATGVDVLNLNHLRFLLP